MSLRDELNAIRVEYGKLTPQVVLDVARSPDHPLHHRFEWDDSQAAERYRLLQARELIVKVRVGYERSDGSKGSVRAFHAIRASDETQFDYEDVEDILRDQLKRKILLRDMEREWRQMVSRFENFQEFWSLVKGTLRRKKVS